MKKCILATKMCTVENTSKMESLSPMYQLAHDEAVEHEEKWSLFDGIECPDSKDEKTILELLEKYSK